MYINYFIPKNEFKLRVTELRNEIYELKKYYAVEGIAPDASKTAVADIAIPRLPALVLLTVQPQRTSMIFRYVTLCLSITFI